MTRLSSPFTALRCGGSIFYGATPGVRQITPYFEVMTQIALLTSRAVVALTGPDARRFLHGLFTQSVKDLAPGELAFGAILTPQGKILFDLFVLGREDGLWLDAAAGRAEALIAFLTRYKLRANAIASPLDVKVFAAFGPGAHALNAPADPRLAELGLRIYGDVEANTDEGAYHIHRLGLGVPDSDRDCPSGATYPIEANFDLLNGIDFKKGCFVGQEVTSRMKRRGVIKSRMAPVRFDGPPPPFGAAIWGNDLKAGEVLSGHADLAMALVRLDRMDGELSIDARPVQVITPSFFE